MHRTPRRTRAESAPISVVIPVKDDLDELLRCLADLDRQTVSPAEVIVVDNGSSRDIEGPARARGARVLVEERPGIAAAASAGYDAARFPVIARCDADSRLPADWLERISRALDDPSVDAVTGPGRFYDLPSRLRPLRVLLSTVYSGLYRLSMTVALGHPPLFGSNCAFRQTAWLAVRGESHRLRIDIHDDIDLSVHLGRDHNIRWLRDLVVGIDSAPLRGGAGIRLRRGWVSLRLHWPEELPPYRLLARRRRSRAR